ncbi:MAG: 2-isopropylmalate synthase [Nitrospinota bacterium]|jgi:2-isopropylmalate synthase|nr:2-isopropylmalate synthase [Nitrospinota bacterium]MDP7369941.1 2-isopropylmalate synthase [Nitrospinota bacterium]MDP7503691.1 2-isopropylmalate synthase [Nitrospinota bacterium]MDP7664617.1 2-isopropylmalate synthase [Nitrospinota bacterium]HJP14277.1 2-isopropylmalate synthase [Nitrospinota bacterium]
MPAKKSAKSKSAPRGASKSEDKIQIFDTTLRDGEQSPGCAMDRFQKVQLGLQLEKLGVDIIEAGFPIASNDEFEAVRDVAKAVKKSTVAGLSRSAREDIDRCWEAVRHAKKPRIHTFIATSDIHLKYKLKMNRSELLKEVAASVRHARKLCKDVEWSAEDATRSDWDFLVESVKIAIAEGATTINLPDTVGYTVPTEFQRFWENIFEKIPAYEGVIFSAHCHNDLGLAIANSIVAVECGVRQVECTINGIGERAGNASLEEFVMALHTRRDILDFKSGVKSKEIYPTSRLLTSMTGVPVQQNKAIVGKNAFAHEAGIHQHGVISKAITYEIMTPQSVGRPSNTLVLGKHSGRAGLRQRYEQLGFKMNRDAISAIYLRFIELADRKKEIYDEDLIALLQENRAGGGESYYELDALQVTSSTGSKPGSMATVHLREGEEVQSKVGKGNGPVDAVLAAINLIVGNRSRLVDFSVNSVTQGRDALAEVNLLVEFEDGSQMAGHSTSPDTVEAAAKAFVAAVNKYKLTQEMKKKAPKSRKGKKPPESLRGV